MKKEKTFQNLILIVFFIFNIYYFYRYIFKYNSEGTSPTYSNTPFAFQVAKYAIALIVIAVIFALLLIYNVKIRFRYEELFIAIGAIYVLVKSAQQSDVDFFIKNFIFIIPAYAVMFVKDDKFEDRFIKANKAILLYHIIYSFIQIAMYLLFGRLPALAYEGALVRFGGGWDDPNAFALYLILPICYIICKILQSKLPLKKCLGLYAVLFVCLLLEVLTFSFSGYLCLCVALIFIIAKYYQSKRLWLNVLFAVIAVAVVFLLFYDRIISLIAEKSGSLAIHFQHLPLTVTNENFLLGLFFGDNAYTAMENYYNVVFANFGIIYFLFTVCLEIYFMYVSYMAYRQNRGNTCLFLAFVFICVFNVCQFALPYTLIFPVNYIYWLAVFWSLREYRKGRRT